jgi:uracil-DNA glycosylase family 4
VPVQLRAIPDAGRELGGANGTPQIAEWNSWRSARRNRVLGVASPDERREALKGLFHEARGCTRCPQLAETRHTVVFGAGNANADLMFVGEAPGRNEDERGLPFVGQAGKLLDTLLGEIGLARDQVFITNVLRCRPPGNRDPHPAEIENCQDWLYGTIEQVQPTVICTLGNFATKLLRGDPTGIMRIHGRAEERLIGPRRVRLFPIFHPAAALYTPANVEVLRADFARLPEILALGAPEQPTPLVEPEPEDLPVEVVEEPEAVAPPAHPTLGEELAALTAPPEAPAEPDDGEPEDPSRGAQLGLF